MPATASVKELPRALGRQAVIAAIVDAAAALIAAGGEDALSMRKLAERCGMAPMSLYRYVHSRDDVLAQLADRYLAEVRLPDSRTRSWRKSVTAVFESVHEVFLRHPALAQVLVSQPRDRHSAYRIPEFVLATLANAGFSHVDSIAAFEALRSYTAGFSARELARTRTGSDLNARRRQFIADLPADDFPECRDSADDLVGADMVSRFRQGLALILDGVEFRAQEPAVR
jgi:AcrR family transcriptional regulator